MSVKRDNINNNSLEDALISKPESQKLASDSQPKAVDDRVDNIDNERIMQHSIADKEKTISVSYNAVEISEQEFDSMMWNLEVQNRLNQMHIYLWMAKDFAWESNNYWMGVISGSIALVWCFLIAGNCYFRKDWEEMYMTFVLTLWLTGNYVWMSGEILRQKRPDDDMNFHDDGPPFFGYDAGNTLIAMYMFITAFTCMLLYFFFLMPRKILKPCPYTAEYYRRAELFPRFPNYFHCLRQYEYTHMLFWIGKDFSWNRLWPAPWIIFFILTFSVGVDFLYSSYQKEYWVDVAHYAALFFWVLSNFAWGYGEQFFPVEDNSVPLGIHNNLALRTGRWWGQVIMVIACIPLLILYSWQLWAYMRFGPVKIEPTNLVVVSNSYNSAVVTSVITRERNSLRRQSIIELRDKESISIQESYFNPVLNVRAKDLEWQSSKHAARGAT